MNSIFKAKYPVLVFCRQIIYYCTTEVLYAGYGGLNHEHSYNTQTIGVVVTKRNLHSEA